MNLYYIIKLITLLPLTDNNGKVEGVSKDGMKTEFKIGFDNILAFTTGSSSEPPIGFHPTH